MAKYHINPVTGNAGLCTANINPCPLGGPDEHFSTEEEAMENYEVIMAGKTIPEPTVKDWIREDLIAGAEKEHLKTIQSREIPKDAMISLGSDGQLIGAGTMEDFEDVDPGVYSGVMDNGSDETQFVYLVKFGDKLKGFNAEGMSPEETQKKLLDLRYPLGEKIDEELFISVTSKENRFSQVSLELWDHTATEDLKPGQHYGFFYSPDLDKDLPCVIEVTQDRSSYKVFRDV